MTFESKYEMGHEAELKIAAWLMSRNWTIFPVGDGGGAWAPHVFQQAWDGIAPDFLCFKGGTHCWVEVKSKTRFRWHSYAEQWQTCMDAKALRQYNGVCEQTGLPVYVFFYVHSDQPSKVDIEHGAPPLCPCGLFCAALSKLNACVAHESPLLTAHGEQRITSQGAGMIYWDQSALLCLATVDEVESAAESMKYHPLFTHEAWP